MTDASLSHADGATFHTNTDNTDNTDNDSPKIAIIGGGLTGLLTATLLERAFTEQNNRATTHRGLPQITLFEKSRSVGRLAARYRTDEHTHKNWQWAFGAQFFTAKSEDFLHFIQPWLKSGVIQPWCAQVVALTPTNKSQQAPTIHKEGCWDTTQPRYISTPKMTNWGRALANELQFSYIAFKTHVAPLTTQKNQDKRSELFDDSGVSLGIFDWVICTAPNAQAAELMADSGFTEQTAILQPKMQGCYTLMLGWDSAAQLPETLKNTDSPWDVAYVKDSILDRIFVEHQKPAHGALLPSVTLHARNDWSEMHIDDDIERMQAELLVAAKQALSWHDETMPTQMDCHRWRYAATVISTDTNTKELGILVDNKHNLIVSGVWCGQGNIESCYRMAADTVEVVVNAYYQNND